ncbi:tryptophan--tRNA ligase [Candidatus Liberibacter africanus]|uniref:tryptophan--tRNA ligase n=1 Tax=Liberibacter africanus TaxID=34020 RepID=UPI001AE77A73|nr:tryptophan--tRNA ligase [Candidatus Liberibacter africanus]QTP63939.1 tryptophan--tRNA ligase [Candidatus Liberibacter africanus]
MNPSYNLLVSGIQPTGELHLGNYLGMTQTIVNRQKICDWKGIYFVADLHAITTKVAHENLAYQSHLVAASFLAAGIDPSRNIIFKQSSVSEHSELAWILSCVARMGWMNNMIQFKEKSGDNSETSSLGLYAYPALMAADILLYRATHVPVGEDQRQHLELTRLIAQRFNTDFKDKIKKVYKKYDKEEQFSNGFFPIIEGLIESSTSRIKSLKNASKKMSKSDSSDYSRINLLDNADIIAKKIQKAKTDCDVLPTEVCALENRLEAKNLVEIFAAVRHIKQEDVLKQFAGKYFSHFKLALADAIIEEITPISKKIHHLLEEKNYLDTILVEGSNRARCIAQETMKYVREIVGLSH